MFKKATKEKLKARIAIDGPAGSGKTYTALRFAHALAGPTGRIAVIDTEHRSASKYTGEAPDGTPFQFDVCELEHYDPTNYINVITEAGKQGYNVLLIDSLSHAWEGLGGALDIVDRKAANNKAGSFGAWRDVTPLQRNLVESILSCPCHVIATMRSKTAYEVEQDEKGKMRVAKVGTKPIQREGVEYEFDVVGDMDLEHIITISKTRCPALDWKKASMPSAAFIQPLIEWLSTGTEPSAQSITPTARVHVSGVIQANPYSQDLNAPCGKEMVEKIKDLAVQCGLQPAQIKELASRVGAKKLVDIPFREAEKLIIRLEQKIEEASVPF